jgi:hypothetical protein
VNLSLSLTNNISLVGASSAFNPLTLSPSALFDATIEPAGAIDQLDDLSGNAKHVTQGTAGFRPNATGAYADFDGTDDYLIGPAISDYIAAGEFDVVISGRFDASATDSATFFANRSILADGGGYWGIGCRSSGKIVAGLWDGGDKSIQDDYTVGADFVVHLRLSGGTASLTIDSRTPVTLASGNVQVVTGLLGVGLVQGPGFMDGRLKRAFFRKTVLSAGELANVKTWAGA